MRELNRKYVAAHWVILANVGRKQWRNRRGGGGGGQGAVIPRDFWPGNFCWRIGKRKARKIEKLEQNRRKMEKGKVKIENGKGKVTKGGEDFVLFCFVFVFCFLFCFCFVLFCFCLFVCLFLLFTFQNDWGLFWVYQNGNFLPGKSVCAGEKIRKNDFAPSEKYGCYAPGRAVEIGCSWIGMASRIGSESPIQILILSQCDINVQILFLVYTDNSTSHHHLDNLLKSMI